MVEKMKKFNFLIYHKTYDEFLESIRQAGVVHVVEKQKGVPDCAADLRKQLATADSLKNTVRSLQHRLDKQKNVVPKPLEPTVDGLEALAAHDRLKAQEEHLKAQHLALQREIDNVKVWGNFNPEMLHKLHESCGRQVRFYSCRESDFKSEWSEKFDAVEIARIGAMIYFITVMPEELEDEPDAERMRISGSPLHQMYVALQENQNQLAEIGKQLDALAVEHLNNLKEAYRQMSETIDLNKVHLQVEKKADDHLILLEGWVPEKNEPELVRALETQDVYYIGCSPDKNDNTAPVLLKNNKFARLFEPIGKLYDLPNYHELDPTPFFAPFYMLFFGICLGDAGYGLLVLIATLIARQKLKPSLKPIMTLAAFLGGSATVLGIITGSLFGIQLLQVEWAWMTSFKAIMVDSDQMFNIALVLGVIQILFAMTIRAYGAVIRYGWAYSLEKWGWLVFFIGCGSLYLASDKEMLAPETSKILLYVVLGISGLLILVLNTPGRNPLINIGTGLYASFNMLTGIIGDVLSYIRLFALGLCGSVMGFVFNDLAMQMNAQMPIIIGQVAMLIILLLGHSINIFMSGIGAFVHPLRLTFVEFYKNVGYQGGGKEYKPFRYIQIEN